MKALTPSRCALTACVATTLLVGCGGLQPPIGTPGARQQSFRSTAHPVVAAPSYQVVYRFPRNGHRGANPDASLIDVNGAFYGTTTNGGAHGHGTIFSVTANGTEKVLYSFRGGGYDGANPVNPLINVNGILYGVTGAGGVGNCNGGCGTVFSVTTTGTEKVLHRFGASGDGTIPYGRLININGTLYGTTLFGGRNGYGSSGCGTFFRVTANGKEKVLYNFGSGYYDGCYPTGALINLKHTLYGTTGGGGGMATCNFSSFGCGTVFSVTTNGTEHVLYRFQSYPYDGSYPSGGLISVKGMLYGTTGNGGTKCPLKGGCGTVFSVTTTGTEGLIYSFAGGYDGATPTSDLINVNGVLYGTTLNGGGSSPGCTNGCGTLFNVTTTGTEKVLYSFIDDRDGLHPDASLLNVNGTLYGTASIGGKHGCCGTVFAFTYPADE